MSRRCPVLVALMLVILLSACELATPPPLSTMAPEVLVTPSAVPATATPIPWPAGRFVFHYLDQIWMAEGAPPYIVTSGTAPALSPDGRQIAYLLPLSPTSALNQVYVLDLTQGQIFLVSGPPSVYGPPVWAPDGRSLAYTNGSILVVTDPRGEVQRVLATDVGAIGAGSIVPAWSADGRTLVLPLTRLGAPELCALNVADGQVVQLTYSGGYAAQSPLVIAPRDTAIAAGNSVLYVNEADGGTLWAARLDGSGRQRVAPSLDHIVRAMHISPDGGRLAGLRQAPGETTYTLWVLDLDDGTLYQAATLDVVPDMLHWDVAGEALYWVSRAAIYRYTLAYGEGRPLVTLPPATPLPTATPLPVPQRLIYYLDGVFFVAEAYGSPERLKEVPPAQAVGEGYTLREGVVAYPYGPHVYFLQLVGGVARQVYTFQQEGLVRLELTWSVQGNALLYTATYEEPEAPLGRRVEVGLLRFKPGTVEVEEVKPFTVLPDRSGATPLLYDEKRGEAVILPWSGEFTFNRLDVFGVDSGVETRLLPVEGERTAAVSADWRWVAAAGYDAAAGHGFIRFYDLTAAQTVTRTLPLPVGSFVSGPLRWSPDSRYLAFVLLEGAPERGTVRALGLWVVHAETLEAVEAVPLGDPRTYLVGWGK